MSGFHLFALRCMIEYFRRPDKLLIYSIYFLCYACISTTCMNSSRFSSSTESEIVWRLPGECAFVPHNDETVEFDEVLLEEDAVEEANIVRRLDWAWLRDRLFALARAIELVGMMVVLLLIVGSVTSFSELPRRISDFLSLKYYTNLLGWYSWETKTRQKSGKSNAMWIP